MSRRLSSASRPTVMALAACVAIVSAASLPARARSQENDKKQLAVKSSWGSFDAQIEADAKGLDLPVYPGARPVKSKDNESIHAELKINDKPSIKFIIGKYRTPDARDKVLAFYQKQLGKRVTKFTEKSDDGSTVFEMRHKLDQRYVSLKTAEGATEIDMVRIEGVETDEGDAK